MLTGPVVQKSPVPLVVIPALNEGPHIGRVARQMHDAVQPFGGSVVVADGGSIDGTGKIAEALATELPGLHLLQNPAQCQSCGINAAVTAHGDGHTHLIRVDAHSFYPDDFVAVLLAEAATSGAASVVVGMIATGDSLLQRLNAATQNARIGNGGSKHRRQGRGEFVDHGHHALIELRAFRSIGGYDPEFTHNEDAELDYRLRAAGHRIWLTGLTAIRYVPRRNIGALARQYFNFGNGRARNLIKHRALPKPRQSAVIAVGPVVLAAYLAPLHFGFALPALLWASAAILGGLGLALTQRTPIAALAGPLAMLMHFCWSLGFWCRVLAPAGNAPASRPA